MTGTENYDRKARQGGTEDFDYDAGFDSWSTGTEDYDDGFFFSGGSA